MGGCHHLPCDATRATASQSRIAVMTLAPLFGVTRRARVGHHHWRRRYRAPSPGRRQGKRRSGPATRPATPKATSGASSASVLRLGCDVKAAACASRNHRAKRRDTATREHHETSSPTRCGLRDATQRETDAKRGMIRLTRGNDTAARIDALVANHGAGSNACMHYATTAQDTRQGRTRQDIKKKKRGW